MRAERSFVGSPLGYITSGQFDADMYKDAALEHRRDARWCFRVGLIGDGKREMRQALRAWRNYRYYLAKVIR
jgi:hypothetical protein